MRSEAEIGERKKRIEELLENMPWLRRLPTIMDLDAELSVLRWVLDEE